MRKVISMMIRGFFGTSFEAANEKKSERPRSADRREIVKAIFHMPKTDCQWRQLPTWSTVYVYYRR